MSLLIPSEIIRHKRNGEELSQAQISAFVTGITTDEVSDAQIAAFAMATFFQGMTTTELRALTLAVRDSGDVLKWPALPGPVVDKHSTGGVGDLVSLVLAPMVAACGGFVPMISGRSLGHTGGTLDKLESIPGMFLSPDIETFQQWVRKRGLAVIGQTASLASADRRMYAVRDSTATVPSVPLIVASILGKKLAEGLDSLVLDVKVGNGAFMRHLAEGQDLARQLLQVARSVGLNCSVVLTDMNQPLARSAGNALEMREAIAHLAGEGRESRLHEVILAVGSEMLYISDLADSPDNARRMLTEALDSGRAAEKFESMVAGQGGPSVPLEKLSRETPNAPIIRALYPSRKGYVSGIDTTAIGLSVTMLGGGRRRPSDKIDPAVGLDHIASIGEPVGPDEPLAVIHAARESAWEEASEAVLAAFSISEERCDPANPAIRGHYHGDER